MQLKSLHYFSAIVLTLFIGLHLFNHAVSLLGVDAHLSMMDTLRPIYRNVVSETILLLAVALQVFTGLRMARTSLKSAVTFFEKLQVWTGLYLALFFVIHLSAVMGGRWILGLDTNLYFGVAGLNTFPFNLFFVPYYGLAIFSFFGHIAAIHNKKMTQSFMGFTPKAQSIGMLIFGAVFTLAVLYGLTNGFQGITIPSEYNVLIGKD